MNQAPELVTESWSAGYEIVHTADIQTYNQEEAIMDIELFDALRKQFGEPIVAQIGGLHYVMKPERAIPSCRVAVPEHNHDDPDAFLLQT